MSSVANVAIHASQFPGAVRRDLLRSLRSRQVNPKLLYDSTKKTQAWLRLHQAYAPSRTDLECMVTYGHCFDAAARAVSGPWAHVIGLGCGGGKKDGVLLQALREPGRRVCYTPLDASIAMALVARETTLPITGATNCFPFVCDLGSEEDPSSAIRSAFMPDSIPILTFFGMLPNFEPEIILPRLAHILPRRGILLLSANLSPGADYLAGVRRILPLYDNDLTREWLNCFLQDLGVEPGAGKIRFLVDRADRLARIVALYDVHQPFRVQLDADAVEFNAGESLRLFFSYRYTPQHVNEFLNEAGFAVQQAWTTPSGEEGVFLVRHADAPVD